MWTRYRTLVFVLLFTIAVHGCTNLSSGTTDADVSNTSQCIPPIATTSYPVEGYGKDVPEEEILPPTPWQVESVVPQPLPPEELHRNFLEVQFSRIVGAETEIWVISDWVANPKDGSKHTVYIYQTNSNEWREVPGIIDDAPAEIVHIYLDKDGTVWAVASSEIGRAYGYYGHFSTSPFIFGMFNEQENRFEALKFSREIPLGPVDFDGEKFWIFEKDGAIFSLNPKTLEIVRHIDPRKSDLAKYVELPQDFVIEDDALAFMEDGSFYFLDGTPRVYYTSQHIDMFHFNPETDALKIQPIKLEGGPPFFNLFVDRSGNLWVSDFGWMDREGKWHQLLRSPVFISTKVEGSSILWERPRIVLESSNSMLWFRSTNGMVSLDPQKGEWCWFTTYQSNIVEDSDHNLWMIADGKLYKLPLGEQ